MGPHLAYTITAHVGVCDFHRFSRGFNGGHAPGRHVKSAACRYPVVVSSGAHDLCVRFGAREFAASDAANVAAKEARQAGSAHNPDTGRMLGSTDRRWWCTEGGMLDATISDTSKVAAASATTWRRGRKEGPDGWVRRRWVAGVRRFNMMHDSCSMN